MGSEGNVAAAIRACADLKEKMKPVREEGEGLAWMELVKRCYSRGIDLTGHHQYVSLPFSTYLHLTLHLRGHSIVDGLANYVIMAATVTEVEIDVLTAMHQIRRCDFIEDTGCLLLSSREPTQIPFCTSLYVRRSAHLSPGGCWPD